VTAVNKMEVGKYIETFDNFRSYNIVDNKYVGDNGIEWVAKVKHTNRMGTTNAIQFNRNVTGLKATNIPGGISSFSVQCKHLYLEDKERRIELLVNGDVVGSIDTTKKGNYNFTVENINVEGEFTLALRNASNYESKSYTIMFDNLTWTPYNEVITGVEGITATDQLSIYSNPSSQGVVGIQGVATGLYQTKVYNLFGVEVLNTMLAVESSHRATLNVDQLKSGMYVIVMEGSHAVYKSQFVVLD